MQCLVTLRRPRGVYNTLAVQQSPAGSTESVRAPGPLDPTALRETEPARAGPQTVHAMLNAGWPALLAAHSFLLTTNLSDSIFGGSRRAADARPGRRAPRTAHPRDAFLSALTLPPRIIAALDEPQQASSHLKGSRLV
jgi:hypothetical protein